LVEFVVNAGWGDDDREDENVFTAHNRRAFEALKESYNVLFF
jgi:hypothetical protein